MAAGPLDRGVWCGTDDAISKASLKTPSVIFSLEIKPRRQKPSQPMLLDVIACRMGTPGPFRFQDIGSQAVVPLLGLQPGQTFLDLCAAPGNKTAQALETHIHAIACDLQLSRSRLLKPLGIPIVTLDAAQPLPFTTRFDRILVDAPCSGTGTLARNPEIKWQLKPEDILDLQRRQIAILRSALTQISPGGLLVYSTCSLEREENEDVSRWRESEPDPHHAAHPWARSGRWFFRCGATAPLTDERSMKICCWTPLQ